LLGFESQTSHLNELKLRQFKHARLFHNSDKTLFIICYNHYLPKIKKPSVEVKISNLITFSIVCCQNGIGTMISLNLVM